MAQSYRVFTSGEGCWLPIACLAVAFPSIQERPHESNNIGQCNSRKTHVRPPPPCPLSCPEGVFKGKGGGGTLWSPPRQKVYTLPSFIRPPTPRRIFSRIGGVGVYKIWPPQQLSQCKSPLDCFWLNPFAFLRDWDGAGATTYWTRQSGGGTRPESCPLRAWSSDPQMKGFSNGISVERGSSLKIRNFHTPLIFGDFTPYWERKRRWPWPRFPLRRRATHMVMVLWKSAPEDEKNDDHDQDGLEKDLVRMWSWSSDFSFSLIAVCSFSRKQHYLGMRGRSEFRNIQLDAMWRQ